jgi:endonuclease/exonuclease/phosphatase family metal-dependent hydrolase
MRRHDGKQASFVKLKVASWNMAHWTHRSVADKAWGYLDREIAADIALLQESAPTPERQKEGCVWREIGGTRRWGSCVMTRNLSLTEVHLERNDYPGALAVGEVTLPDESTLIVVSIYGLLDVHGYSITTLHRMLSDLTPLFNGELQERGRPRVILGGDLNASIQFDQKQRNNSHRIFFQRLEDFGLVDCQGAFPKERPRTLRRAKGDSPWVNDYMFASENLAGKVLSYEVIENPEILGLSDHNPLIVTFDLEEE